MFQSDEKRLSDILRQVNNIFTFMKGKTKKNLEEDLLLEYGINRALGIIGEAAGKLSKEFKDAHPDISWGDMIGLRNRIIHDYDGLDFDILYNIIKKMLPDLRNKLKSIPGVNVPTKNVLVKKKRSPS